MTEFAIVAPILFFIIFAIVQICALIITKNALTYATRLGARTASIHGSEPNANDQICASLRAGLSTAGANPDNLGTVTIFKATQPLTMTNDNPAAHDVGVCTGGHWNYTGDISWPYYARGVVDPPDPIGIKLTYQFHFLLPMFGDGLTLQDATIMRVEPLYALGSSGLTLPTPYPTYTSTPNPTYTPYPNPTPYPSATACPTFTPTISGVSAPTSTPGATPMPGGC